MLVEKGRFSVVEETKNNVAPTASVAESIKHRSDVCLSVCLSVATAATRRLLDSLRPAYVSALSEG